MKKDEIELKELLVIVYNFFAKNKMFWLVTLVIAIIAFGYKYNKEKPYYNSDLIVTSNLSFEKTKGFFVSDIQSPLVVLNILQEQVKKHNYQFLKNTLGISNPKNIKAIKIKLDNKKLSGQPQNILISIELYDTTEINNIQNAILKYCNTNKYIINKFDNQKALTKKTIQLIDERVNFIDTLEYLIKRNMLSNYKNFMYINSDWSDVVALEIRRYKMNQQLLIKEPITVVQPFLQYSLKSGKKLEMASVYFILIFILGTFVLLTIEFIKYTRNVKK